jgi:hypothetical protein
MTRPLALATLVLCAAGIMAQSPAPDAHAPTAPHPTFDAFDVATIRPADTDTKGRYLMMQGTHRFVGKYYTLKLLIAAAYDLNPRTISGGPGWAESDHFDILAVTPGDVRPTANETTTPVRLVG